MRTIKPGMTGPEVEQWQYFLLGEEFYMVTANGKFDEATTAATKQFQQHCGLKPDAVVGPNTYAKAFEYGFIMDVTEKPEDAEIAAAEYEWPAAPVWNTLTSAQTEQLFGKIEFEPQASGNIRITNEWDKHHLVRIFVPQLLKIGQTWGHDKGHILFHKDGAAQMIALWDAWEKAGFLPLVTDWCCSFSPRYIRGSEVRLSTHCYGIAFDINIRTNALGKIPPARGEKGSVREMVPIANELGFYWGGHFRKRKDGMHFEIAQHKNPA